MITSFQKLQRDELENCGGKGKSLVEMTMAGFSVPYGFIINSDEFMKYCAINGLLEVSLEEMWQGIIDGKFSDEMSKNILELYMQVFPNNEKVAVRSSALCEDSSEFAWSGELETYLFIDKNNLLESIKKCFASLFTKRALLYAKRANISRDKLRVAVIVQKQIESQFAGVAFSNNPLNGKNDIMIETVSGQGERLVSGEVIPDRYVYSYDGTLQSNKIQKSNIHIAEYHLSNLLKNIKQLKEFYNFPVDIEWAIENDSLFILQCRPITTITIKNKIREVLPQLLPASKWNFDTQAAFNYMFMHSMMSASEARLHEKVFGFHRQIEDCLRVNGQVYKLKCAKDYLNKTISDKIASDSGFLDHFAKLWADVVRWEEDYVAYLLSTKWDEATIDCLISETEIFAEKYKCSLVYAYYFIDDFLEEKFISLLKKEYGFSQKICKEIFINIATCSNNLGTLSYSEEPIDLLKIAIKMYNGENVSQLLDNHVSKYAWMLAPVEREFKVFEKKHYEQRINDLIKEGNISDRLNSILLSRKQNDIRFYDTIEKYRFNKELIDLANNIRTFIYYRTFLTEHTDWLFFNGRTTILREIARREEISEDDLVMLSFDEVISFLKNKISKDEAESLAHSRIQYYAIMYISGKLITFDGEDALDIEHCFVPSFIESQKTVSQNTNTSEKMNNVLVEGTTCYPGRVIGKVKIVRTLSDCEKVHKGDILVANMTTPNFISAMERAAGFVTDQGGITCHAAILSREMKIPCIVGTSIATKVLHDEDTVEVDAYLGTIRVLNNAKI